MKSPTKTLEAQIANLVHNFEFLHGKKVQEIKVDHHSKELATGEKFKTVSVTVKESK